MAELLGWPEKAFLEAFQELLHLGMAEADFQAPLVFLPNAIKYNRPQSPNVIKHWSSAWAEVPECELKQRIRRSLEGYLKGMSKGFQEAFERACPKFFANQEQLPVAEERNQEQDKTWNLAPPPVSAQQKLDRSRSTQTQGIPEWVPLDAWNGFLEMRRLKKEPLVGRALAIAISKLKELRANGEDVGAVLDQSTVNGWKGLFPVKNRYEAHTNAKDGEIGVAEKKQQRTFSAIDRATEIRRHRRMAKPADEDSSGDVSALPTHA